MKTHHGGIFNEYFPKVLSLLQKTKRVIGNFKLSLFAQSDVKKAVILKLEVKLFLGVWFTIIENVSK